MPRHYLNVPFAQKDAAKSLGARFDGAVKRWYVEDGRDLKVRPVVTRIGQHVHFSSGTGAPDCNSRDRRFPRQRHLPLAPARRGRRRGRPRLRQGCLDTGRGGRGPRTRPCLP
ncbi:DUF5710 domain-containing protein [Pseudacidovorax sp.]|uniref:DUF5710 domain-containing protein n=1 Tax=Pseudacidovorax sp. TaxID=1934311 RepID=UPI0025CE1B31|nr:DUF5710 domain-containing protein [Pseudacidovorax sp.]